MLKTLEKLGDLHQLPVVDLRRLTESVWGKSAKRAGGSTNLLIAHMLDTAAVAELIWDRYLSAGLRNRIEGFAEGRGKQLFMWLCAIHDLGKASPAFQSCDAVEAQRPRAAGLSWNESRFNPRESWRHDRVGASLLRKLLKTHWSKDQIEWVWPLIAGHHGTYPPLVRLPSLRNDAQEELGMGTAQDSWSLLQRTLLEAVTSIVGFQTLEDAQPAVRPSRSDQLALSGFIIMADWIASNATYFQGLDSLDKISLDISRDRARTAWQELRLRHGWGSLGVPSASVDLIEQRFGKQERGCQPVVVSAAHQMPAPGLMVVEAPPGEGKTHAALAGAEVLAARFGCDGVLMAMPTQATCAPMYDQVVKWVAGFDPDLVNQVQLLHGKRRFDKTWKSIWERPNEDDDDYGSVGEDELFGSGASPVSNPSWPATWLRGRNRGLLTAFGVATFDQLLFAATRTNHVMLRFSGLAGKVIIIDEVHAVDVYMSQFLLEVLRLLGGAGVPVILLSATLPPTLLQELSDAYADGAVGEALPVAMPACRDYPRVTTIWAQEARVIADSQSASPWREDLSILIEVLEDTGSEGTAVADRVESELRDGGTALIIVNWVERAQRIYERLKSTFEGETLLLLHGRLSDEDRATTTDACLEAGRGGPGRDPKQKRVIIATQVAEQSFDIDADVLITDIAPVDLIVQRLGRMHRDPRTPRPERLRRPKMIITGLQWTDAAPKFQVASDKIYSSHLLLRTAAQIWEAIQAEPGTEQATWAIPSQIPQLVADGYGQEFSFPVTWQTAAREARVAWETDREKRRANAKEFVLTPESDQRSPTLAGLHRRSPDLSSHSGKSEEALAWAAVRDGDESIEVVMVRRTHEGYTAMDGTRLGANGEVNGDTLANALGGTVRLRPRYTDAAERELRVLPGWEGHPWLGYTKALELDEENEAVLDGRRLRYDSEYGLRER